MTFSAYTRLLPILVALLLPAGAHAQTEDRAAKVRKDLRIDTYKNVSYFDEKKNPITSAQFDERIRGGAFLSMEKKATGDDEPVVKIYLDTKPRAAFKPSYKVKPGDAFPEFSHMMLTNVPLDSRALMGRYTIISFYFAACAPCIEEIPELNAFAEGREDMNYLGITFDPIKTTRKFVEQHKLGWTLLSDAAPTISAAGVKSFPSFALLDPKGKVIAIEPGFAIRKSDKTIAAWVARLVPELKR